MSDEILKKIKKLFALANNNSSPHEAELASVRAHELMMKHNIEQINTTEEEFENSVADEFKASRIEIDAATLILRRHYLVEVIYLRRKNELGIKTTKIKIYGTKENIEIAEYVYKFLTITFQSLWQNYKKKTKAEAKMRKGYIWGLMTGLSKQLSESEMRFKGHYGIIPTNAAVAAYVNRMDNIRNTKTKVSGPTSVFEDGKADGKDIRIAPAIQSQAKQTTLMIGG